MGGRSRGEATGAPAHVRVPTPSGEVVLVDPRVHREDVVRRLLTLGVSPGTLLVLLPGWQDLIQEVAAATLTPVDPR